MTTSGTGRALAIHPSEVGSDLRADAVPESGFSVRIEVEAGAARNNCTYDVRLLVRNLSRFSAVTSVRPPRFSGNVNDGVLWFGQNNEFVFTVDMGDYANGDLLELIGSLRIGVGPGALYSTVRSETFQVTTDWGDSSTGQWTSIQKHL